MRYLRLVGSRGYFANCYGFADGRRVNSQHCKIVRAIELITNDPCRLQDAIGSVERMFAFAFVHALNPAFQNIEHLKFAQVLMEASHVQVMHTAGILLDADSMGTELPMRGLCNTQVALFHKAA